MSEQSQAVSSRRLRVFLCHSSGDKLIVRNLYQRLRACNVDPWLDKEKILPGQDWELEIQEAVRKSDIVVICLSRDFVIKEGYGQKEIKLALDTALEKPFGTIFLIPLRLEECEVPVHLQRYQRVDYFEEKGFEKLMSALKSRATSLGIQIEPIYEPPFLPQIRSLLPQKPTPSFEAPASPAQTSRQSSTAPPRRRSLPRDPKAIALIVLVTFLVIGSTGFFAFIAANHNGINQASATATALARATTTIRPTTPSPTTPTATGSNSYPPKNAHLDVNDPLTSPTPGWGVTTFCQFIAGAYQIQSKNGLTSCTYPTSYTNFVYEIRMKFVSSDPKSDTCAGIIFRFGTSSQFSSITIPYYSFLLCTSGACKLTVGGDPITPLGRILFRTEECPNMDKTPSHANLIAVIAQGKNLSAFVNKVPAIPEVTVNSSSSGEIGVIAIIQPGEGKIAYNDAKVWTL